MKRLILALLLCSVGSLVCSGQNLDLGKVDFDKYDRIVYRQLRCKFRPTGVKWSKYYDNYALEHYDRLYVYDLESIIYSSSLGRRIFSTLQTSEQFLLL